MAFPSGPVVLPMAPEAAVDGRSRPLPMSSEHQPVFVHSSFRTSSTWLWGKLRAAPTTVAYYEYFHELMETLSVDVVRSKSYDGWASNHPPSAPYFLEFLSARNDNGVGVRDYQPEMATKWFIPAEGIGGAPRADEERYVNRLIAHAQAQGKVPVLSEVRTLGRVQAFRRAFGGVHVLLVRNLFHQWASFSRQAHDGSDYFFVQIEAIVQSSLHDPIIRALDELLIGREPNGKDEQFFQLFVLLHLYFYAQAFDAADCFMDVSSLNFDLSARESAEYKLSRAISHPISLSDVQASFEMSLLSVGSRERFVDLIEQFTKHILRSCPAGSAQRDSAIVAMQEATLIEWDRHEFYSRGLRSIYLRSLDEGARKASDLSNRVAELSEAHEALNLTLSNVSQERDELMSKVVETAATAEAQRVLNAALELDRADLAFRLAQNEAASDAANRELDGLREDREVLEKKLLEANAELDRRLAANEALRSAHDNLRKDREALAGELIEANAELARQLASSEAAMSQCNKLREELARLEAERIRLEVAVDEAGAAHEALMIERDANVAKSKESAAEIRHLCQICDLLRRQLADASLAHAEKAQHVIELTAQRDSLARKLDGLAVEAMKVAFR